MLLPRDPPTRRCKRPGASAETDNEDYARLIVSECEYVCVCVCVRDSRVCVEACWKNVWPGNVCSSPAASPAATDYGRDKRSVCDLFHTI